VWNLGSKAVATEWQIVKRWFNQSWVGAAVSRCLLALALMLTGLVLTNTVWAKGPALDAQSMASIGLADLPKQGRETHALILAGGPFPYEKDGTVFGNRERILPAQKRGYYREYTVKTPYARTRGAKRIVCGGMQSSKPEVCYYTEDHYNSFKRIAP
jgi:ribonuclease T1